MFGGQVCVECGHFRVVMGSQADQIGIGHLPVSPDPVEIDVGVGDGVGPEPASRVLVEAGQKGHGPSEMPVCHL